MPYPEAILFDWDSTLVDGWDSIVFAWNESLAFFGKTSMTREQAIALSARPQQEIFLEVFGEDDLEAGRSRFYGTLSTAESHARMKTLPGSHEMLVAIAGMSIPMAIVSNKAGAVLRQEVARAGWSERFFAVVGSGDAAFDKPRPDPLLFALASRMIAPSPRVWMVGDMHSDMEAAHNAGVTPVLIETTARLGLGLEGNLDSHKPASRVSDARAFLELVKAGLDTI